jgi:hypothetical protein
MALGNLNHERYKLPCGGKANALWQQKHCTNCALLIEWLQFAEWSRKMSARAKNGSTARAVVPVSGGVQLHLRSTDANEKLLDQEAVVEDDVHY